MVQRSDVAVDSLAQVPSDRMLRRYGAVRWILAAAVLLAVGCQTPYEAALSNFSVGEYDVAEERLREGLDQTPEDTDLNLLMARLHIEREDYRKAEPFAQRVFDDGEQIVEAGRLLGKIHWELSRPVEAAEAWRAARQAEAGSVSDTDYIRALEAAIATAMNMQQFEQALSLREELAELDADHSLVEAEGFRVNLDRLAQARLRDGAFEEAAELYAKLSKEYPEHARYALSMGRLLVDLDRPDEAIDAFERYVEMAEADERVGRTLEVARRAKRMGSRQVAIHFFEAGHEAMGAQPSFRRAKLNLTLAGLYFEDEQHDVAKEYISRYLGDMTELRGLPLSAEVFITAADTASEYGHAEYSLELLEQGLKTAPVSWNMAEKLASLYARRAQSADVERVLKTYVERADRGHDARIQVGRWALGRRNYEMAQHFFEQAVEHEQADSGAWLELARIYSTLGQVDRLEHALDTYIKRFDHTRYELLDAASMYQNHRLFEQAEEVLLDAHEDDPKSLVIIDRMSQLYTEWGKPNEIHTYYETWAEARGGAPSDYQLVGERFIRNGQHSEALSYLQRAAEGGAHHSWLQIADIYARQRRSRAMKQALESYRQEAPLSSSTLHSVLSRYQNAGMTHEAIETLEKLVEFEPGSFSNYQRLSRMYMEQGREREALELWTHYLDESSRPLETLESISEWLERRGQHAWVLSLYRHLLDRDEVDPRLYRLVGDTYLTLATRQYRYAFGNQVDTRAGLDQTRRQARHFYRLYLDKASPSQTELLDFADDLRNQQLWELAASVYEQLADDETPGSQIWLNYGKSLLQLGRVSEAEEMLARYYRERGENVEDARIVAEALFGAKRYETAEPYLRQMFDADRPNFVSSAFRRLAQMYRAMGKSDQLDALIADFVERAQNPTKARQEILRELTDAGLYAQAAEQIERLRAFQGDVRGYELGVNLFRAGRDDKAHATFSDYADQNSDPADAWELVGDFYLEHGRHERAKKAYERSVELAPDSARGHRALGRFLLLQGDVEAGRAALQRARETSGSLLKEEVDLIEVDTLVEIGRLGLARDVAEEASSSAREHRDHFTRLVMDYDLATSDASRVSRVVQQVTDSNLPLEERVNLLETHGLREEAATLIEDELNGGDRYTAAQLVRDRGDLLTSLGGIERLVSALRPVLDQPGDGPRTQGQLGEYLVSEGHYQRGIPLLRAAIGAGHTGFRPALAHAYAQLGYSDQALRVLQKHLQQASPEEIELRLVKLSLHFELRGEHDQWLNLLRMLSRDRRFRGHAAPRLVGWLAQEGRLDDALGAIYESTHGGRLEGEDQGTDYLLLDEDRHADLKTLAANLEAVAAAGYVDEALAVLEQLPAPVQREPGIHELGLRLRAAHIGDEDQSWAYEELDDVGVSSDWLERRLDVARLAQRHGDYTLADELAKRGLDSDLDAHRVKSTSFLVTNARATDDLERVDELADQLIGSAQDTLAARREIVDVLRNLGLDRRAADRAIDIARESPVGDHLLDALIATQSAGDADQMAEMIELLLRAGQQPISQLDAIIERLYRQQPAPVTRAMLGPVLTAYPAHWTNQLIAAELDFRDGRIDQARERLLEVLEQTEWNPYAVEKVLARLAAAGLHVESARFVGPKLEGKEVTRRTHLLLGLAHRQIGMVEEAAEHLEAHLEASPDKALAATVIARELERGEFLDEAHDFADRAIQMKSDRPEAYFYRGVARLRNDQVDLAEHDIEKSIGGGITRQVGLQRAAYHALVAEEDELAEEYLQELVSTYESTEAFFPFWLAIDAFADAGRFDAGVAFVEQRFPALAAGRGHLGSALIPRISGLYEQAGAHERAYEIYDDELASLLIRDPYSGTTTTYMNNLAYTYSTTNRHVDRGLELVRRAIASDPARRPSYIDTLGWLHYRRGELERADQYVGGALRTSESSNEALAELVEHMAEIRRSQGRQEEAIWLDIYLQSLR
jgi:predicted Zn-dependent protease